LFAINAVGGQIVMVDHGNNNKISIIVDVHRNIICPDCPPPSTPPDPDCHPADSVRDHLGQGPYDTMMTISDTGSRTGADSNVNQTSVSFTSEVRNRRSVRRSRRTARSSFNPPPKRV
jgi:hypothetical protein